MAQANIGEFFHSPCSFQRFLNIYREPDTVVEPCLDPGVVRPVRCGRRTLHNVAVPRAVLRFFKRCLVRPEVLRFKKILIAETGAERAIAPLVEGHYSWRL